MYTFEAVIWIQSEGMAPRLVFRRPPRRPPTAQEVVDCCELLFFVEPSSCGYDDDDDWYSVEFCCFSESLLEELPSWGVLKMRMPNKQTWWRALPKGILSKRFSGTLLFADLVGKPCAVCVRMSLCSSFQFNSAETTTREKVAFQVWYSAGSQTVQNFKINWMFSILNWLDALRLSQQWYKHKKRRRRMNKFVRCR